MKGTSLTNVEVTTILANLPVPPVGDGKALHEWAMKAVREIEYTRKYFWKISDTESEVYFDEEKNNLIDVTMDASYSNQIYISPFESIHLSRRRVHYDSSRYEL